MKKLLLVGILVLSILPIGIKAESITFSISTDQKSYQNADIISIFGEVEPEDAQNVIVIIENPKDEIIFSEQLKIKDNGTFSTLLIAGGIGWENSGIYIISSIYKDTEIQNSFTYEIIDSKPILENIENESTSMYIVILVVILIITGIVFTVVRKKRK